MRTFSTVAIIIATASLPSCALFLPAHSNSACVAGERVELLIIDVGMLGADMTPLFDPQEFKEDYKAVFLHDAPVAPQAPSGGPMEMAITGPALASAAVGLAVDFVQHRLEEETEHYRAQFKGQATGDNFWWVIPAKGRGETAAQFHANIAGFRLRRYWRDGSTLASEVTFGMSLSNDGTLFRLCPLSLQVSAAKAKVLSDEWRWLPLPTTWIRYALGSTGHGVAITTDLHMNAFSLDKDRKLHVDNLAGIEIPLPDYDINLGARLRTSETEPTKKLRVHPTGWLLAPPFPSLIGGSKARLAGAFDLTVVATESDPSNAKRLLERLAKRVGEEKDRLMKIVQN